MAYSLLPDRGVLEISGDDAREFLQGLISNDIRKVAGGEAIFAALLTPQGKFLHDFFISEYEGKLLLETDKARLPDLKKRLLIYKLRSHVEITERTELQVAASWGEAHAHEAPIIYADPRLPALGTRMLGELLPTEDASESYHLHRIELGVPEGSKDLIVDRSLLLEYGYDELHGIDFTKGCYVGQEVTARSKHRASLRKFIHMVLATEKLPAFGTPVLLEGKEVGQLAGSIKTHGLAHLRVEGVAESVKQGKTLTTNGITLHAILPVWCTTRFSDTEQP